MKKSDKYYRIIMLTKRNCVEWYEVEMYDIKQYYCEYRKMMIKNWYMGSNTSKFNYLMTQYRGRMYIKKMIERCNETPQ